MTTLDPFVRDDVLEVAGATVRGHQPHPVDEVAGDAVDTEAIVAAARRIAASYPSVTVTTVRALLVEHLRSTRGAKVQTYRLLLAERSAHRILRNGHRER